MSLDCIYRGELPPRHFNTAPYCLGAAGPPWKTRAWAKDMHAKRKMLAASSADDARAYLAGQRGARRQTR